MFLFFVPFLKQHDQKYLTRQGIATDLNDMAVDLCGGWVYSGWVVWWFNLRFLLGSS